MYMGMLATALFYSCARRESKGQGFRTGLSVCVLSNVDVISQIEGQYMTFEQKHHSKPKGVPGIDSVELSWLGGALKGK